MYLPVDAVICAFEMDAVHRLAVATVRPAQESLVERAAVASRPISSDKRHVCRTSAIRHQCAATPTNEIGHQKVSD